MMRNNGAPVAEFTLTLALGAWRMGMWHFGLPLAWLNGAIIATGLRAPGASVPDGRTIRYDLQNRSRMLAPRILYRLPTPRAPQWRDQTAHRGCRHLPQR